VGDRKMKAIFRRHPYLFTAFLLAAALTLFFAVSSITHAIYMSSRPREAVAPWMTVGYVAHSWGLKGPEIDALAGLPLPVDHPLTLNEIAAQRGVPVADIVALVEAAVAELTAQKGPQP
jgi:hypothetical protein